MIAPIEDTRPRRILAAEDNEAHQHVLRRVLLSAAGDDAIDLSFVGDGRALVDTLRCGARPDLVLLDMHMPRLSGCETLAEIRRDPDFGMMPIVMLSSSSERHHVDAAYRNGANAYLVKRGEYRLLVEQMRHFVTFWLRTTLLPSHNA